MSAFKIICPDEQMAKIEEHCFSETRIEVGGFLIGKIEGETTTVTQAIAAQHTVGQSTQLTFTHDTWNDIYAQMANLPADEALIGWYHSHPNFGVFLSEHDQFIQNNFFKNKGQITIVVDPIRGRSGWFRSVDGKIRKYGEEADTMKPRLGVSATNADANMDVVLGTKTPSASNLKIVAISGIMAVISFVAGLLVNNIGRASEQQTVQANILKQLPTYIANYSGSASLGLINSNSGATTTNAVPVPAPTVRTHERSKGSTSEAPANPSSGTSATTAKGSTIAPDKAGGSCPTPNIRSVKKPALLCAPSKIWIFSPATQATPAAAATKSPAVAASPASPAAATPAAQAASPTPTPSHA